ncbi:DNA polymerase III subunit gamma/tau [Bartonella sp. HY329]|uniref:DNA polymerase III subunit gamma/tau n=1 Tax=unclassified Bartonella TaxID=2645622 RepID=UPI0021C97701|nr:MULTISPECIES: DNA polymerase III subunit gamma/tau [unclassified Bartonella]UXM95336.1 DNA polymerase III subunit gamma/tau [Bartonella sp. HY329]UXN09661.1 DNA polymerase III subunit gamma/tau [Bartonella sp. HY328]
MDNNTAEQAYRVLARKYRPQDFSDLIGQEPMVRTLTNAFEAGRIAQAWMLTGVRGVGKTTTARILARALNYKTNTIDRPTIDLSVMGEHCQAIMEGRHVDVVEMDAASHTGIDDIREIIEQVRYRPVSARYKVYIIDEVHMLSTQAFNGLLKTLEEPPPHVKFIFATTEIRKVPITVLSRCQRFDLRRIDSATLTQHLQKISAAENIAVDSEALAMIARAGEGSVRDALSILDQAIAHGAGSVHIEAVRSMLGLADRARIIDLFELIMSGDIAGALQEFKGQYDAGADPVVILTELADFNHLVTRLRFTPQLLEDVSLSEEERRRGADFASKLSIRTLSRNWQMLLKGISEADNAPRPLQAAEMLLIRLAHAADLPTIDEALKAIADGKTSDITLNQMAVALQKAAPKQLAAPQSANVISPNGQNKIEQTPALQPLPPVENAANVAIETTTQLDNTGLDNKNHEQAPVDKQSALIPQVEDKVEEKTQVPDAVKDEGVAPLSTVDELDGSSSVEENSPLSDKQQAATQEPKVEVLQQPEIEQPQNQQNESEAQGAASIDGQVKSEKKKPEIKRFNDLITLADENRDLHFKFYLKEYVRPITVKQGVLEYVPTDDAPRNLSTIITKTLLEWTGERWAVTALREGGGMTMAEAEQAHRDELLSDAEADPDVGRILAHFPGAKIVDVRLNNIELEDESADDIDLSDEHADMEEE